MGLATPSYPFMASIPMTPSSDSHKGPYGPMAPWPVLGRSIFSTSKRLPSSHLARSEPEPTLREDGSSMVKEQLDGY